MNIVVVIVVVVDVVDDDDDDVFSVALLIFFFFFCKSFNPECLECVRVRASACACVQSHMI